MGQGNMIKHQKFIDPLPYGPTIIRMGQHVDAMAQGMAMEECWWLSHQTVITAGRSAKKEDLLTHEHEVIETGRGGQYTIHNPGQRIIYPLIRTERFQDDVRAYLRALEQWIIDALNNLGVHGRTIEGRTGVWVGKNGSEEKIAALGIRVSRRIFLHGLSINVDNNLGDYEHIVPCGIDDRGVTSLKKLGIPADMNKLDQALMACLPDEFLRQIR